MTAHPKLEAHRVRADFPIFEQRFYGKPLAFLDSADPLTGRILIGEIDRVPAAAMSLDEGRIVADPFQKSDALRVHLRMRAAGIQAHERTPSVRDRIRAAMRRERMTDAVRV